MYKTSLNEKLLSFCFLLIIVDDKIRTNLLISVFSIRISDLPNLSEMFGSLISEKIKLFKKTSKLRVMASFFLVTQTYYLYILFSPLTVFALHLFLVFRGKDKKKEINTN